MGQVLASFISLKSFYVVHRPAFYLVVLFGILQIAMSVYSGCISVKGLQGRKTWHYVGFAAFGLLLLGFTVAIAYLNDHNQLTADHAADQAKHDLASLHDDYVKLYARTEPPRPGTSQQASVRIIREVHDQIGRTLNFPVQTPVVSDQTSVIAPVVPRSVGNGSRRDLSGESDLGVVHALEGTLKRMSTTSSDFHQRCQLLTASLPSSGDDSTTPIPPDIQVPITDAYRTRTRNYDAMIKPDISTAIAEALRRLNVPQPAILGQQIELDNLSRNAEAQPASFATKSVCKAGDFSAVQAFTLDIMKRLTLAAK